MLYLKRTMSTFKNWTQADVERHNEKAAAAVIQGNPLVKITLDEQTETEKKEHEIQEDIESFLKSKMPRCWWTRSRMDRPTTNRVGCPDFLVCYNSRFIGIEVKRPGKKPTQEQRAELAWIHSAGGIDAVVTSRAEVESLFALIDAAMELNK